MDVRVKRATDVDSDHHMVVAAVRMKLRKTAFWFMDRVHRTIYVIKHLMIKYLVSN